MTSRVPDAQYRYVVCFLLVYTSALGLPEDVYMAKYRWAEEGDINIGAILSIHSSNSLFNCTDTIQDIRKVQNVEALSFAVQDINARSDLLPNLTLGFHILDDCLSPSIALARAIQFMPRKIREGASDVHGESLGKPSVDGGDVQTFYDVVGVIGTYTSTLSIVVANVMSLFKLPQISHTATSDVLSDKNRFPYFFRMVPPDRYQAKAITSVLHAFNWSHVSIVYSEGNYGRDGVKELQNTFQSVKHGVCIEESIEINYGSQEQDFINILARLKSHEDTRVVVAFVEISDAIALADAVGKANVVGRFVWLGSDSFSLILEEDGNKCSHFPGSIFVHPYAQNIERFGDHLKNVGVHNSHNPWLRELMASAHDNTSSNDIKLLSSDGKFVIKPGFVDSFLIDSVYAFAHAIDNVVNKFCSPQNWTLKDIPNCVSRIGIFNELKTIRFNGSLGEIEFNKFGDVKTKYEIHQCVVYNESNAAIKSVGFWDMTAEDLRVSFDELMWTKHTLPFSACPRPCTDTIGTIYYFRKQTCCHACVTCKVNEIVTTNATRCEVCPEHYWPDDAMRTTCLSIPPVFFGLQNAVSIGLCAAAILGVITCIWVTATLVKYHEEHVIKCFSVELSGIILLGTLLTYGLTGSFLSEPNTLKCYVNHVGFSLTFTIIYAPLLVKTNRIYRIFNAGRRTTRKPCLISNSSQVTISLALIIAQVVIVIISTSLQPPEVILQMPRRNEKFVELFCNLPHVGLLVSLSYNLVLVVICAFYAFKTRKLPDNYKESRYIAFCVDTTLLIWVTFVPTYFTATRAAAKTTILAVSLLLNASVTLTCLFITRIMSLFRSLKDSSRNRHDYKDFRIVKHVVKRKRSCDHHLEQTSDIATKRRLTSAPSAQTLASGVNLSPEMSFILSPRAIMAISMESCDFNEENI
ncbi:metabotropic glutamate receptor 2-like [Dreissena polymorpha]|uniref:G-protein coupled receptors family 3 profile domain-containing protein n=1 Tax=Dreissena polymorpha TaxID=45954 RepID=A0A9D4E2T9_DREPO|nr:metabotropic glutamate receptor 2-like [Dreissena polymorpha]XP_052231780.1 metabotropic glutamate receptor 2-like [Dreissena polymorpha]KAH3772752.1 hypothetical protein DPMN_174097 [Dreissena polymorpha]